MTDGQREQPRADDGGPEVVAREQRLVFGEVALQYEQARPSYPDGLFDTILEYASMAPGDTALEIGAGTGKATRGFIARDIAVHALEPSPEMAAVLRGYGVDAEETTFEGWDPGGRTYPLVYAAQAWHWVHSEDRYEKVASVLASEGTLALFWNVGREWVGALGADNDAVYDQLAPNLTGFGSRWSLDRYLDQLAEAEAFDGITKRIVTWEQRYSSQEWMTLLGTHSDHRILPEEQRTRLHAAVGEVIDHHGGYVDMTYDTHLYLATRT